MWGIAANAKLMAAFRRESGSFKFSDSIFSLWDSIFSQTQNENDIYVF